MLTAALCIKDKSPYSIQVVFGKQGPDDDSSVTRANVSSILNDPRFDPDSLLFSSNIQYDLAILTLSEEVPFTPACLPGKISETYADQMATVNERYIILNNLLQEVNVTITTNEDCLDAFKDDGGSSQIEG